jgi:oxygen-dependent protoporphyrinogen oxidase
VASRVVPDPGPASRVAGTDAQRCWDSGRGGGPPGSLSGENRNPQSFDALILAVPAHAAARLLESTDHALAAELAAIPYASCAVVSLGFDRCQIGHPLDGFGFVVPQRERRRIIAASFASLKYPGRAPDGCVLIRTFIGGALQPQLLNLADAELTRVACEELSALLSVNGDPLVTDVARWPASMPQYHVGHLDRVARIEQLAARWPNLALAGNAYHGVGIPHCIASGQAAAERLANALIPG